MAVHKGSHDSIGDTVYHLYQKWLPNSEEELRDYPCYFRYLNFVHEVNECELLTEIYLPIKQYVAISGGQRIKPPPICYMLLGIGAFYCGFSVANHEEK